PIRAAPIGSGRAPYALENRTRSVSPPMLMRAFIRSVWLANAAPSAGAGAAVQVPTQCRPPVTSRPLIQRFEGHGTNPSRLGKAIALSDDASSVVVVGTMPSTDSR